MTVAIATVRGRLLSETQGHASKTPETMLCRPVGRAVRSGAGYEVYKIISGGRAGEGHVGICPGALHVPERGPAALSMCLPKVPRTAVPFSKAISPCATASTQ